MPKLHKYRSKAGYYVLTSIGSEISTFQLTEKGVQRLLGAGFKAGDRFRRAILFDLWRKGDAFTLGASPGIIEARAEGQLELDLRNDPERDIIFTGCSKCGSLEDLHLVEVLLAETREGSLLCPKCRNENRASSDLSFPISLISREVLLRILEKEHIERLDRNAGAFKEALEKAFNEKWDSLAKGKAQALGGAQERLFEVEDRQKKLV